MKTKKMFAPQAGPIHWGYGRVSTLDQNPDSQHDALLAAGVSPDHMYIEKASTRLATRPKLEELRKLLRPGDKVTVTKADRIARSTLDLLQIVRSFDEAHVELEILTGPGNRDDPYGKAMFGISAVFAELERDLIQMRTNEGLAAARARGRKGGRRQKLNSTQEKTLLEMVAARERPVTEIAQVFGISREAVYGYIKRAEAKAA
jgi:DNA invertase Pin-like site-specific DNA recombinase